MSIPPEDPVSGPNPLCPERMSPDARLAELGRILAAGVVRLNAGKSSSLSHADGDSSVAERHVSRQLRLAYLAPEVLKRLTCSREASAVSLYDLCFLAGETWNEQAERVFA